MYPWIFREFRGASRVTNGQTFRVEYFLLCFNLSIDTSHSRTVKLFPIGRLIEVARWRRYLKARDITDFLSRFDRIAFFLSYAHRIIRYNIWITGELEKRLSFFLDISNVNLHYRLSFTHHSRIESKFLSRNTDFYMNFSNQWSIYNTLEKYK